jgi:hypothetical protein
MRQNILIFAGIAAILFGVLFMLQGLGIVRWPASSSMIDQRVWLWRGLALAVGGAILVGGVRLVPTRAERRAAKREGRDLD